MKPFEYFKPTSLKEAQELLTKYGENAAILNGGTDLIVRLQEGQKSPEAVIDIKGIKGLDTIQFDEDRVTIGALVLLNDLGNHAQIKSRYPFLAQAALSVGSKQVRNRATCVGNICNASPLADTATPLMTLNAHVQIYSDEGLKSIPLSEFFVFVRKTILKPNEIVTGITFVHEPNVKGIFTKMSRRKEVDLSTVCATVLKQGTNYRISCGAVAPTPIRLQKTEAYLSGVDLSVETIEQACDIASDEVKPISDIRASEEYRREMVKVMLKQSLTEWL